MDAEYHQTVAQWEPYMNDEVTLTVTLSPQQWDDVLMALRLARRDLEVGVTSKNLLIAEVEIELAREKTE
jgi:hypothetical protein